MKKNKILQTILIVAIGAALILTGCGPENLGQSNSANGDAVAMTINGRDITVDELGFYISNAAGLKGYANGEEVDWNQTGEDGKPLGESIKEQAIKDIVGSVVLTQIGEENGAGLTDEEKGQIDSMIGQVKTGQGDDYLRLALEASGVTSEKGFKSAYELLLAYSKASQDIGDNRDKYIKPEDVETLSQYKSDERASVQHILILNDSEKFEDPKATIDEVLNRAKAGEDFTALMTEYNEDPGETPGGYTFGRGEMVQEFETASFALDYNEISDVVESSYGYHVIKRLLGTAELQAYLTDSAVIEKNDDVLNAVTTEGIMDMVNNAVKELTEMQGGSN